MTVAEARAREEFVSLARASLLVVSLLSEVALPQTPLVLVAGGGLLLTSLVLSAVAGALVRPWAHAGLCVGSGAACVVVWTQGVVRRATRRPAPRAATEPANAPAVAPSRTTRVLFVAVSAAWTLLLAPPRFHTECAFPMLSLVAWAGGPSALGDMWAAALPAGSAEESQVRTLQAQTIRAAAPVALAIAAAGMYPAQAARWEDGLSRAATVWVGCAVAVVAEALACCAELALAPQAPAPARKLCRA